MLKQNSLFNVKILHILFEVLQLHFISSSVLLFLELSNYLPFVCIERKTQAKPLLAKAMASLITIVSVFCYSYRIFEDQLKEKNPTLLNWALIQSSNKSLAALSIYI